VLNPPPTRKIPILLGGGGERKTLALAARFADIWNTFAEGEDYERKSRVLDEHCARAGRDPAAIERSVLVGGPPEKSGEPLLAMGARLFILSMNPPDALTDVERWVAWRDRRNA
jgi:alkanesulfonate monooxygenase SsuD/methylene tetrahydromethanopterin reductase-like flavin-dependent oxidoreductase (luciferase family)